MKDRFTVVAVYDQVARRAEIEAVQLGCKSVEGLVALIDRPDVDVDLSAHPAMVRPPPDRNRLRPGQADLLCLAADGDVGELERLDALIRSCGIPFMPEFARRFYPTTLRLRELLATMLGPPRLVVGQGRLFGFDRYGQPGPSTQIAPAPLARGPRAVICSTGADSYSRPSRPRCWAGAERSCPKGEGIGTTISAYLLEFEGGAVAQVSAGRYHRAHGEMPAGSCPSPESRSSPSEGSPGWRCPTGSSGPTPRGPTRSVCRWSRPSASFSTTISTGWCGAPRRWPQLGRHDRRRQADRCAVRQSGLEGRRITTPDPN